MKKTILPKIKETITAVLPISILLTVIKLIFLQEMPWDLFVIFLVGMFLLMIGMFLFSLGTDTAMVPIGQMLSKDVTKSQKIILTIFICFIIGLVISIAEPNLHIFADQIPKVKSNVLVLTVGIGIGTFLIIGLLRTVFKIKIKYILAVSYFLIILIMILDQQSNFISIAFDAAGATTGPISVPFIMSFGAGLAAVKGGKTSESDSFGLLGICAIGPVLSVLILGLFSNSGDYLIRLDEYVSIEMSQIPGLFLRELPKTMLNVALALSPILILFTLYKLIYRNISHRQVKKLIVGMLYTYIGITIFSTGANIGFIPMGQYFGKHLAALKYNWILIPIGFVIGVLIIAAEPAVHVLKKQVEEITGGAISEKVLFFSLAVGIGLAISLSIIRALYHVNILFFLIPGYVLAVSLSFVVPEVFTALAFDSGTVASGVMAATFIVPLTMGVYLYDGPGSMINSFGAIAFVTMMPIITIQIMGLIYKIKSHKKKAQKAHKDDNMIVELES